MIETAKRYLVTLIALASFVKCLSTASLPWLASTTILGAATYVAHGSPNPIAKRREYLSKLDDLAKQAEVLEEAKWELEAKLQETENERGALTVQTNDYATQLKESAEQQIYEIVQEYEERLAIARDERLLLEDRNNFLLDKIDSLQAPKLPTASDPASLLTAKLCSTLSLLGCAVDYERCWYDSGEVIAWIVPRKGGIKAVTKHADELQLKLALIKKPLVSIINGVVQVAMTPQAYNEAPTETPLTEVYDMNTARQRLLNAWTKEAPPRVVGFIEPLMVLQPVGGISKVERDWVLHCHYEGRDARSTIARVYGITGVKTTQKYQSAKERYDSILKELQTYDET